MIVADTSALMEILLAGPEAERCSRALDATEIALISAGTLAEALIVAERRGLGPQMRRLLAALPLDVRPVVPEHVLAAHNRWGKGVHPAGLNLGDGFAYALAAASGSPLLFVGRDFARTDLAAA